MDSDRRHQIGIAADEGIVLDDGLVLVLAVIVAGDGAAADIDMRPYGSIAHIRKMRDLAARSHLRFFELHEVAHLDLISQHAAGRM